MSMVVSKRGTKAKGSTAERYLLNLFWANGWAAMRAAGSGSTQFPCPDLLVGKNGRRLAIEVKITADNKKYFPKEEIQQLQYFSKMFGAECWVAVKFSRIPWKFFLVEDLIETDKSLVASPELAELKGLAFEELEQ